MQADCPEPGSVREELNLGGWVDRFGGNFYGDLSKGDLIWAALNTDELNLLDLIKFGQGNRFSLNALHHEYATIDLTRYRCFEVPIFFLLGRHDWHVPSIAAARYFQQISAPYKRLVWFEQSAHNPPFAQPDKFAEVMLRAVLPIVSKNRPLATAGSRTPDGACSTLGR